MTAPAVAVDSRRWWSPRGETLSTYGDDFLPDPEDTYGRVINPHLKAIEALAEVPCAILLGAPGSGKSTDIRRAFDVVRNGGGSAVLIDCRDVPNGELLTRRLTEDPAIAVADEQHPVTLFVDSFDEGLLSTDTLGASFMQEFRRFPPSAIRVRIACRDGEWPSTFEDALRAYWAGTQVFELAPFTLADVRGIASRGVDDVDAFLDAAIAAGVKPLLVVPVTLNLLVRLYGRDHALPSSRVELYRRGTTALCEEHNPLRRERRTAALSATERHAIATRAGAFMVLSNRNAIWRGLDHGDISPTDIPESELVGGTEPIDDDATDTVSVTGQALHETLTATALFPTAALDRVVGLHRSFVEHLAARWVARHHLQVAQVESLFFVSVEERRRVPPQLRETASWLAAMRPDVFRLLLENDPAVLVMSDIFDLTDEDKARLITGLLDAAQRHEGPDGGARLRSLLARLKHPGLAGQLRAELATNVHAERKEFALRVIAANRLSDLTEEVAQLAFNSDESTSVRALAVEALGKSGDGEAVLHLLEIALRPVEDEDQRLLGWALDSLWPEHITFAELLSVLAPVRNEAHVGAYQTFLWKLQSNLSASDAKALVEWLAPGNRIPPGLKRVASAALVASWPVIATDEEYNAFARVLASLVSIDWNYLESRDGRPLMDAVTGNVDRRRRLLVELLALRADNERLDSAVLLHGAGIRVKEDAGWALRLLSEPNALPDRLAAAASGLAILAGWMLDWSDARMLSDLLAAIPNSGALQERFGPLAMDINSAEADRARETEAMHERIRAQTNQPRPALQPPPAARIEAALVASEAGNPNGWLRVDHDLSFDPAGHEDPNPWRADTRDAPGWLAADDTLRQRILDAAVAYLMTAPPDDQQWLGSSNYPYHVVSAFRALRLMQDERPERLVALDDATLARWVPVIVHYHAPGGAELEAKSQLLQSIYARVPDRVLDVLRIVLVAEDSRANGYVNLDGFEGLWDSRFSRAMVRLAEDRVLSAPGTARLLEAVLANAVPAERAHAREVACRALRGDVSVDADRTRAVNAASVLLSDPSDDWGTLWAEVKSSSILKDVLLTTAPREERRKHLLDSLSESELADLFSVLEAQFPHDADRPISGFVGHEVGADDSARGWRDDVLRVLAARGTPASLAALRTLQQELPHLSWLDWVIAGARQELARLGWRPVSWQDLRFISQNPRRRLIRDGTELMNVVIESLADFQQQLTGDTPLVEGLWDRRGKTSYRPKPEGTLANAMKRHLDGELAVRGVISNREVEIRQGGLGGGTGSRTDIHVDVAIPSGAGTFVRVTLVIEVKGAWNAETTTALKDQLVNKYLAPAGDSRHGLFVVGWYDCPMWDKRDRRRGKALGHGNMTALRRRLNRQARSASQTGLVVRACVLDARLAADQVSTDDG